MRCRTKCWTLCFTILLVSSVSGIPQTVDSFNPNPNGNLYAIAEQSNGKILVAGDFTNVQDQIRNRIARFNSDGSIDVAFNPGVGGTINSLALQPDGKILVAGAFTTLGGQPQNRIARLWEDGSIDASFHAGASNTINCIALQADGKVLVGGSFTNLAGQPRARLGRLNHDGTLDATFTAEAGGTINSLALQPDGKILVGGSFTILAGQSCSRLGRLNLDGTFDTSFNSGTENTVRCLSLQADGKILVGGSFVTLGGNSCGRIGRLHSDGTFDATFNPQANNAVYSCAVQADGRIIVSGTFTNLAGILRHRLGRLNSDGSLDLSFNAEASGSVFCVGLQSDSNLLLGGTFTNVAGQIRTNMARLNNTLSATQSLIITTSTIDWLRGGGSPEASRTTFEVSTNGHDWKFLGNGVRNSSGWQADRQNVPDNASIRARAFVTGGRFNASSWFQEAVIGPPVVISSPLSRTNNAGTVATFEVTTVGEGPLSYQWRKNNQNLTESSEVTGTQTPILILSSVFGADAGDYSVVITNAIGTVTSEVARLSIVDPFINQHPANVSVEESQTATLTVAATGSALSYQWRHAGTPVFGATNSSLEFTNAQGINAGLYDVIVTGSYSSVTSAIVMLTVNLAQADSWNPGAHEKVFAIVPQPDGKVLIGGYFNNVGDQLPPRYKRLNVDGTLDTTFSTLNGLSDGYGDFDTVEGISLQEDGKILLNGVFHFQKAGANADCFQRLETNGIYEPFFHSGLSFYQYVFAHALQSDGKMIVGGIFSTLKGQPRSNLGRFNTDGSLDMTFNPSTLCLAYNGINALAVQPDGKILVGGGFTNLAGGNRNFIARLNPDGTLDDSFNPSADRPVSCLALQADGRILVSGNFSTMNGQSRTNIARLNNDGSLDMVFKPDLAPVISYQSAIMSMVVQTDGKILLGGLFSTLAGQSRINLGRLYPDGTLDATFNPSVGGASYNSDGEVFSLGLQADGKILVGGGFTTLAHQPRACLGRLNNTTPATQNLMFDGSTITWLRGGSSPEVWRTTFDISTNGFDWIHLGSGMRISGGWQHTGLAYPTNSTVRARGFLTSGLRNSSCWFVETISAPFAPSTSPAILLDDGRFGFRSNQFGFNLSGRPSQMIVLEGSTDFSNWISLATNTLGNGPFYFADRYATNFPHRFYRTRTP